jgi:hypothetical protein
MTNLSQSQASAGKKKILKGAKKRCVVRFIGHAKKMGKHDPRR